MATWLSAKKAAEHLKKKNPDSMIGEFTIRTLIKNGFPHIKIESRHLINIETFDDDMIEYAKAQMEKEKKKIENAIIVNGIRRLEG